MAGILFLAAPICALMVLAFRRKRTSAAAVFIYACVYLITTVILLYKPSGFTPYFEVDSLNRVFLLALGVVFFAVSIYNIEYLNRAMMPPGKSVSYALSLIFFVFCMTGVLLSTHLGVMWVFLEATALASAYLIYFNATKQSLEAAWKYLFICSIGIALAFVGIILLSMGSGSPDIYFSTLYSGAKGINEAWLKFGFAFMLVGFGTKIGFAPVHAWLPDAHSEAPSPISAMLSGTLLNAALIALLRVYKLMELSGFGPFAKIMLITLGFLSVFVAAVFIMNASNYKRMLAYSSIENMGIIAIGTAVGGYAVLGAMIHILAHSLAKASLFLTSGNILHIFGSKEIKDVSGINKKDPVTGWLWITSFLAISGMPPFPSFISEFLIFAAMIKQRMYLQVALLAVLLTAIIYGMGRIVFKMSLGAAPKDLIEDGGCNRYNYIPQIALLAALAAAGTILLPQTTGIFTAAAAGF
jgi:hydrogenase-4 component F